MMSTIPRTENAAKPEAPRRPPRPACITALATARLHVWARAATSYLVACSCFNCCARCVAADTLRDIRLIRHFGRPCCAGLRCGWQRLPFSTQPPVVSDCRLALLLHLAYTRQPAVWRTSPRMALPPCCDTQAPSFRGLTVASNLNSK